MERGSLLQVIPRERLTSKHKQFYTVDDGHPIYKLTREPTRLDEFDWVKFQRETHVAIWRKNATLICVSQWNLMRYPEKHVYFTIHHLGKTYQCAIFGQSDDAIAKTATFFWSLTHSGESNAHLHRCLWIDDVVEFNFAAFQPEQIAQILDANSTISFAFRTGVWNAAQCAALATRPYPLNVRLAVSPLDMGTFLFEDGGRAFVDALQMRKSPFGELCMVFAQDRMPRGMVFSHAHLKRLCELEDIFDKLDICPLNRQSVLLPFSAKVKALDYKINSEIVQPNDFNSLDIATKDLNLKMYLDKDSGKWTNPPWTDLPIAFLNRAAQLSHFERLSFSIDIWKLERGEVAPVAEALIRAIRANPHLTHLDLTGNNGVFGWTLHLPSIFEAMEDHPGLRTFVVDFGTNPSNQASLERLLSRNPNITVCSSSGKVWLSR